MKSNKLFDAIGMVKDEYINDAKKPIPRKKIYRSKWLYSGVAAALACAILIGAFVFPSSPWFIGGWGKEDVLSDVDLLSHYAIAKAYYPATVKYPKDPDSTYEERKAWRDSVNGLMQDYKSMPIELDHFFSQSIPVFLSGDEGENRVYSPLNVYMALGMLAETTNGNSRAQVLNLLGTDSITRLRQQSAAIWKANYRDDGMTTCLLANSLWLREQEDYHGDTVSILSRDYYASVFRGEMGSDEYNSALRTWLNKQTGGLLEDQINLLEMSSETVLALASTVWFEAAWDEEFIKGNNDTKIFHAPTGDTEATFMNQDSKGMTYYWGDQFGAINLRFITEGYMTVILPNEGVSAESLLSDTQCMDFVINRENWENYEDASVKLSIPKFDVSSQIDLRDGLKALGVTDIFNGLASDFSAITSQHHEMTLTQATHGARVQIDEEGCVATAYTFMDVTDGGVIHPEKEIDFIVDRPFLFVIYSPSNLPLFVGIVNQPQ